MDLNSAVERLHCRAIDAVHSLAHGEAVAPEHLALVSRITERVCRSYASGDFLANIGATSTEGPAILQHFEALVRAESALKLYRANQMADVEFRKFVTSTYVPSYLHPYYLGIDAYLRNHKIEAYNFFDQAKVDCGRLVQYLRFIDTSMRGILSARPLSYLYDVLDRFDPSYVESFFPMALPPIGDAGHAHVVACDAVYLENYKSLFLTWAVELSKAVDLWVLCVDCAKTQLEELKERCPRAYIATCQTSFPNKKSFYSLIRFPLAERLIRAGYGSVSSCDIDLFVYIDEFMHFINSPRDGIFGKISHSYVPWRGSSGGFTLFAGASGRQILASIATFLMDVFRPDLSYGNLQWWIEQYILIMLADAAELGLRGVPPALRNFHVVPYESMPIAYPTVRTSKDEFMKIFTTGNIPPKDVWSREYK
jgi:hypothetical protein